MKLALIDLDGVIANDTHRVDFALDKDWVSYFDQDRMAADGVWQQGRDLVIQKQEEGWTIAYLTGRRSALREVTEAWLDRHGFPWGRVNMREPVWHEDGLLVDTPVWPPARLADFKVSVIERIIASGVVSDVVLFDDDPEVIRAVQEQIGVDHGVLCEWSVKPEAMVKKAIA